MVLVRSECLCSDSERKLLIGQFNLTHVKYESPDMFENRPRLPTGSGGMFISSKLGQNISEMDVRTFVRTQRVIWDHLLAFKAEIIQNQALFQLPS